MMAHSTYLRETTVCTNTEAHCQRADSRLVTLHMQHLIFVLLHSFEVCIFTFVLKQRAFTHVILSVSVRVEMELNNLCLVSSRSSRRRTATQQHNHQRYVYLSHDEPPER